MDLPAKIAARVSEVASLVMDPSSFPLEKLNDLTDGIYSHLSKGGRLAFVGNGGSAAEAMHLAAEFTGKCVIPHPPVSAICLNESQSAITAIGNDYGFEEIFSRQVKAHLTRGDYLIALSTSGKSPNILKALESGIGLGVKCYLWTGIDGVEIRDVDTWRVPSHSTPRIQEIHLMWGHFVAEAFEELWRDNSTL